MGRVAALEILPGEVLAGRYRVESELGRGGMGVVLAVRHIALDTRMALKVMRPEVAAEPESARRFVREARAAARIESDHVVRVFDVGTLDSGQPYMAMEHLEGMDLGRLLAERGPLPAEDAVAFLLQAIDALSDAHALGIVHRDLKPSNLFVVRRRDGTEELKVLDFGAAKIVKRATPAELSGSTHSQLV
ncbi:MAG TPA: serine/threonine-protein kinase, partial [Polyangiaceae bacterium]|nr:serine/threonine-protein kinase [Polyangiaceae bacterium]